VPWLATAGGLGYAPVAPGTVGAAAGVGLFWGLSRLGTPLYALTLAAGLGLAVWVADGAERAFGHKDDQRIVIDEVVGQLLALLPLIPLGRDRSWGWVVTGFVLFRCFDVWKPGPVRLAEERLPGGLGTVMDDAVAGLLAAALLGLAALGLGAFGPAGLAHGAQLR
jgi:phosphatidylglycerophosphatase A